MVPILFSANKCHLGDFFDFGQIWDFGPLTDCRNRMKNASAPHITFGNISFGKIEDPALLFRFGNVCTKMFETVEFPC